MSRPLIGRIARALNSSESLAAALRDDLPLALPVRALGRPIDGTGSVRPAALGAASWRIDFVGGPGTVTALPAGALVALARSGVTPAADNPFNGKIVLIGATFPESRDLYPTPVGVMPGLEIHASIIETLLSRRTLLPPPAWLNLALLGGTCLAVALLSVWLRPLWVAMAAAGLVAVLATVSYEAYARGGYWLDFVGPVVGMLGYLQGARALERRRLRRAFGEFVSPDVVARVSRDGAALGGEVRTVSVLMSDVRGFRRLSRLAAEEEVRRARRHREHDLAHRGAQPRAGHDHPALRRHARGGGAAGDRAAARRCSREGQGRAGGRLRSGGARRGPRDQARDRRSPIASVSTLTVRSAAPR
jgi:CHASE2 domain